MGEFLNQATRVACFGALLLAAGCQTTAEVEAELVANDDAKCLGYGFVEGSPEYANCRMQIDQRRQDAAAAHRDAYFANRQTRMDRVMVQPPAAPTRCTTDVVLGALVTKC